MDRRDVIKLGASAAVALRTDLAGAETPGLEFGEARPFGFDALIGQARRLAAGPYLPAPSPAPDVLEAIDYDAHGRIRFKAERALFSPGGPLARRHPATFFHLGRYFRKPQRIHVVDGGIAREIVYREDYFDMPADSPAHRLPRGAGFAGFRFQEAVDGIRGWKDRPLDWRTNDWVAFLGAAYFRAIGSEFQYGLSARGVLVDAAVPDRPEEFPDFTHVWLEQAADTPGTVTAYALLDGPSLSGAFRFIMRRDAAVTMDVEARLFLRRDVTRLGLAPLTSMYWFSETIKPTAADWRPEVHDSDGLALWTGSGERIWRPLNNPPRTIASAFADRRPRGFGLLQRDRAFDNYQDGVFYERRPSLWVEPKGDWGAGAVQLIEIPTDDEIHDNIVAAFVGDEPATAGNELRYGYWLHWSAEEPFPTPLARVVATRMGNGGQPGLPRPRGLRKFMVEFRGGALASIPFGQRPEVSLSASRGSFSYVFTEAVPNDVAGHWRAQFDFAAEGSAPVEMRAFLRLGATVLSESWLYQYHPF